MRTLSFILFWLCCSTGFAAFSSSGLETFAGSALDTVNWGAYNGQYISQDNGLIVGAGNAVGESAQYTSTNEVVNVGGSAKVQVTLLAENPSSIYVQDAYLGLTPNLGSGDLLNLDETYSLATVMEDTTGSNSISGFHGSPGRGGGVGAVVTLLLNHPYTLTVTRLSSTSVQYTAKDSNGTILSNTQTWPAYTGPLYVAVGAEYLSAEFNQLQLSGNYTSLPEPLSMVILPIWYTLLRRRSRRC